MDISFLPSKDMIQKHSKEKPRSEKRCFVPARPIRSPSHLLFLSSTTTTGNHISVVYSIIHTDTETIFHPHTTDIIDINTSNHLKVVRALDMLVNVALLSRVRTTDHIGLRLAIEQRLEVRVVTGLKTALTAWVVWAVAEVRLGGLALLLERRLADVRAGWDVRGALDPLEGETAVNVPHDMAVHQPRAWVVRLEADDGVAGGRTGAGGTDQQGSVTTHWVVEVEGAGERWVPGGASLAQNAHVVAVQMHGVRGEELVLDDEVVPLVLLGQEDGVADAAVVGVALSNGLEGGLRVVDIHGAVVQEPAEDEAIIWGGDVGDETGGQERGRGTEGRRSASGFLDPRNQLGEGLVKAEGEVGHGLVASGRSGKSERSALICDWTNC